jgi:hypothetical protein
MGVKRDEFGSTPNFVPIGNHLWHPLEDAGEIKSRDIAPDEIFCRKGNPGNSIEGLFRSDFFAQRASGGKFFHQKKL